MSTIEEEIAAVKTAAANKLRRLREREAKGQRAVDLRIVVLLRAKHSGAAAKLEVAARAQLDAEVAERSARARTARAAPAISSAVSRRNSDDAEARHSEHGDGGAQ